MSEAGASAASSADSAQFGGRFGVLRAHLFHILGIGGLALLAGLVLAAVLIALLALILLVGGGAILAHVERVEKIVDGVAELALVFEQPLQPVEATACTFFNERPPEIDKLPRRPAAAPDR